MLEELEQLIQHLQQVDLALASQVEQTRETLIASQGVDESNGIIRPTNAGLKVVLQRESDVAAFVYDALRETRWSLQAWPGKGRWSDKHYVQIFTKDFAEIASGLVYHLTPAKNAENIRKLYFEDKDI